MEKILSVVIPAYNSQETLERALVSLLDPEVLDRLEILVVDDGSRDGTGALAERYSRAYPHTVRVIRQENRGHGGAVSRGIHQALGRYVRVLDSDDWADTPSLGDFLDRLEQETRDVILTHYLSHDRSTGELRAFRSRDGAWDRTWTPEALGRDPAPCRQVLAFHGITYRRQFYESLHLELTPWVYYEDQEFLLIPLCCAETVGVYDLVFYHYQVGTRQQTVSRDSRCAHTGDSQAVLSRLLDAPFQWPALRQPGRQALYRRLLRSYVVSCLMTLLLDLHSPRAGKQLMAFVEARDPVLRRQTEGRYLLLQVLGFLRIPGHRVQAWIQGRSRWRPGT